MRIILNGRVFVIGSREIVLPISENELMGFPRRIMKRGSVTKRGFVRFVKRPFPKSITLTIAIKPAWFGVSFVGVATSD